MASTEPNYFQGSITCIEKAYSKQTNIQQKQTSKKKNKERKKERTVWKVGNRARGSKFHRKLVFLSSTLNLVLKRNINWFFHVQCILFISSFLRKVLTMNMIIA